MSNHLSTTSSPYLRQHAENPVEWYPWGEKAFARAAAEDKPVFLSIGYSTCHWCHVMAHESFEDPGIAGLMNAHFINIKVDREERPDVDQVYMAVCQAVTGRGGWPLTIVMTPDKRPFFAGTYLPPESSGQRMGMRDLILHIGQLWKDQRDDLLADADRMIDHLKQQNTGQAGEAPDTATLERVVKQFQRHFDPRHGGFGPAPKFPSPHNLILLLREARRTSDRSTAEPALETLRQMRHGGLWDHLGFGFHRYSTDAEWHLPHFEKMLYDQALLMRAYTEAWQFSGEDLFRDTVDQIFRYLQRDLRTSDGVYASAEDADSEGEEGKFYVWSHDELSQILESKQVKFLETHFRVKPTGNFNDESTGKPTGLNILHLEEGAPIEDAQGIATWETIREHLLKVRIKRIRPGLDTKILVDWNGLVIASLAYAGRVMQRQDYLDAARKAATFITTWLYDSHTGLQHRLALEDEPIGAFLDDYAFLIWGLRELYQSNFDPDFLEQALTLQEEQIQRFWDNNAGGFWFTAENSDELFIRKKESYDGAIPSGNALAAENLFHLARLTGRSEWEKMVHRLMQSFGRQISIRPRGHAALLWTTSAQTAAFREIVVAGESPAVVPFLNMLNVQYDPFRIVLYRIREQQDKLDALAPFTRDQNVQDGRPTIYVCENFTCQRPLQDLSALRDALSNPTAS